jgi:DNA gyrase subunit A
VIKKTLLEAYSRPRQNGVNAITVKDGDQLLEARMTGGNHEILMAIRSGKAIRFHESTVRPVGRTASGVRGITLAGPDDEVVGMVCVRKNQNPIFWLYLKMDMVSAPVSRITGSLTAEVKGVKTINITEKTGSLIALLTVN